MIRLDTDMAAAHNDATPVIRLETRQSLAYHTSAVRAISFASCNSCSGMMTTGGGRSELFLAALIFEGKFTLLV